MSTNAATVTALLSPHQLAIEVSTIWSTQKNARLAWEQEMLEIRNFVYATDTRSTQVGALPFKNSTTVPKLAQIATNLLANYSSHLFSNPKWAQFQAADSDEATKEQKNVVEAYVRTKVERKKYEQVLRQTLVDWVNTGVCYAAQGYVTERGVDAEGNEKILYQGTELQRIPPMEMVFDITAESFEKAVKIRRRVFSLGDIARDIQDNPDSYFDEAMLEEMRTTRMAVRTSGIKKAPEGVDWQAVGLQKDGFGDLLNYMNGDMVEVLEFYGDLYSMADGEFRKNHKIVIADRRKVIFDEQIDNENGSQRLYYAPWEQRPDNLMGMSPLARIVGMQYKLDKLENLRADVFDNLANPPTVEVGTVEFFGVRGAPGSRYVVDEGGSVTVLNLSKDALNADFQIDNTMNIMEMMAGSPQSSSGFRTPGEKTKFEVQVLDNGGNRIFRDRTGDFEVNFIEPVLNDVVAIGRENLGDVDVVSTTSTEFNIETFLSVTREDLFISGRLKARGSKLHAEKANALQNLTSLFNTGAGEMIKPHVSTKKMALALEELADFKALGIIVPNIGIQEAAEQQQLMIAAQNQAKTAEVIDADGIGADEVISNEDAQDL